MTCLITGCALYLQHARDFAWGDLHQIAGCYVFNGMANEDGGLRWYSAKENHGPVRAIVIPFGEEYFERRGVLVLRASRAFLTPEALAYIGPERDCTE